MALDNTALFEEAENKKTQLEQVFASTSDGFLVVDLGGRIVGFNRQGGELLGVVPDEVVGRSFQHLVEVLGPAVAWEEGDGQALLAMVDSGRPAAAAGDLELRAPEPRTLGWRAAPMRDLLGATVGVTFTLNDVTRQREIDRMKTEFVSTVSHELRTPLTSIKGSLHLLLSDPALQLDATQRQLVDISVKNTDRLIRLITNILDISKIEAGHIQLELGMHRVEEFVSAAVDGIAAFAESRSIAIAVEVAGDLPQVRVDVDRMVQVVTNLLSNAIKFSPPGSTVTVTATRAGRQLVVRVTDRGRGIAAEDMGKLFKKFQQLDGSNVRSVGGTGLGLAICRGIVEEHGGTIGVESQLGQGATFTVTVPLPAGEGVDRHRRRRAGPRARPADPRGRRRARHPDAAARPARARGVPRPRGGPGARGRRGRAGAAARPHHHGPHAARPRRLRGDPAPAGERADAGDPGGDPLRHGAGRRRHAGARADGAPGQAVLAGGPPGRHPRQPAAWTGSLRPMSRPRVLVVDDEADISTVLSVTLRRAGFDAADGRRRHRGHRGHSPRAADLVILDVMMPRSDGLETLKQAFEQKHPGVKVIVKQQQTNQGVTYLRETRARPEADIFWVSAVDAFQTLKAEGLLDKLVLPKETLARMPARIGGFPLHDPDGQYWGFAVSGYGLMWNTRYLALTSCRRPRSGPT